MLHANVTLDDFARGDALPAAAGWPQRIVFGLDAAAPPLGALQVQFARFEFVIAGTYTNLLCDRAARIVESELGPGDALVVPGNCWNQPLWDKDVEVLSLLFGATHLGVSLVRWNADERRFVSVEKRNCLIPGNGPLQHMVDAMASHRDDAGATSLDARLLAQAVLEYSRRLIANPMPEEDRQSSAFFRAACLYIEENFDRLITRDTVAAHLRISPNYFSRVFREQGATTFSDYLTQVRIGKAKFMLEKYDLPLSQIAQRCGFNDFNYFYKVFKKVVGRTPTEYRNSVQAGAAVKA
ncbi:helix-turn-helix transcriptional regulator [Pleomorphomonas oryzae]|uniref:helix-turn-helix transcriptional regulator n=1 Tax=Pleomorphomonas oryzae TaxID=261934 RepID=UPI0004128C00|nr:AraC family transcriptional regulator [Pleomorphomonas oryzae]